MFYKSTKYLFLSIGLLFLTMASVSAQSKKILQFSGLITSTGSDLPVGFVTIKNTTFNNQTFMSNNEGYFSFVAHVGDVIEFTSVGFDPVTITIPEVEGDKYTASVKMRALIIELPAVTPFPWASYEDYLAEFMGLGTGEDPIASARRNLSPDALAALASVVPRNAEEIQTYNSLQRHQYMQNKNINQRMNNPFLNPFNWYQFINSIKKGDYSREKLKY
ncbi:carboxypeptidase-like regulatory domain-containing protein [Sphingobacterium sp. SGL-16]|uniref:Carboxypeptidase-like regulatory domain-containing protein n=2 Tax=Sphingobacterium TaxID=28453 RepID=A0ABR7YHU4_9SPHI|nr:carboxypeptidase-like regulatory domain-containing protein [Sphingobacterium litopenaei]MBD1430819.1 hypothetical protein [Sphingobacterium litopenaei]NGM74695.1 carboxypeptidase-like regulatory domain-containing protein [Sphingobacterium sp. SGL-16]